MKRKFFEKCSKLQSMQLELSVGVSSNCWKLLKRFVESIYLNTASRIKVCSSYEAAMEPPRSTLHIYLGINVIYVL